jgi:hypothetical protein
MRNTTIPCLLPNLFQFASTVDLVSLCQNTGCVRVGNAIKAQRLIKVYAIWLHVPPVNPVSLRDAFSVIISEYFSQDNSIHYTTLFTDLLFRICSNEMAWIFCFTDRSASMWKYASCFKYIYIIRVHVQTLESLFPWWRKFPSRWLTVAYLLSWSKILLEKLANSQLAKKCPVFYGNRRLITAFIRTRYLSLSWARSVHCMPPSN